MGGVIKAENIQSFRRMIFRQLKGKTYVHTFEIKLSPADKLNGDGFDENRYVFILAFQGGNIIEDKIRRICNAYADI
jgi:hypothetical protein